jgi:hypothetical protein
MTCPFCGAAATVFPWDGSPVLTHYIGRCSVDPKHRWAEYRPDDRKEVHARGKERGREQR